MSLSYAYVSSFVNPDLYLFYRTKSEKYRLASPELTPQDRQKIEQWLSQESLPVLFSGVYNWAVVFSGAILPFQTTPIEEYAKYDVLHVNLFHQNLTLPTELRRIIQEQGLKTKLVVNLDYSVDLWHADARLSDINILWPQLDVADYIFSVEERQRDFIEYALRRPVHFCPHPIDVDGLRYHVGGMSPHGLPLEDRLWEDPLMGFKVPQLLVNFHRWESIVHGASHRYEGNVNHVTPYLVVKRPHGRELPCRPVLSNIPKGVLEQAALAWGQENVMPEGMHPMTFMRMMSQCRAALDVYSISSYGRFSAETAALGVPTVGTPVIGSMKRCWPNLIAEYYDVSRQHELLKQLLTDDDFWLEQVKYAARAVDFYGYDASKARFEEMLQQDA